MELNNYIQNTYGRQYVAKYDVTRNGPAHNCTWNVIAYSECASHVHHIYTNPGHAATVNGVEYGQKSDTTKKAAHEKAARQALAALKRDGLPGENRSELSGEGEAVEMEEVAGSGEASGATETTETSGRSHPL